LYFMTHAYFCFYHSLSNMVIRRVHAATENSNRLFQVLSEVLTVFVLSYLTAIGETVTISHFPYYQFLDRTKMYSIGSLFYAIYFFVSFPLFYRMDESTRPSTHYSIWRTVIDSLGGCMLVTLLLDFWRITYGSVTESDSISALPWDR
jgi:cycloeucalenol cycloisomerase